MATATPTISDLVSTKRDLLNQFAADFATKDAGVTSASTDAYAAIAAATDAENSEAASLAQFKSQLDGLTLAATLTRLTTLQGDIQAKFAAYTALVQSNNAVAETLFDNLTASQDTITQINATVDSIHANIASIKTTLTAAPTPAPAPAAPAPAAPAPAPTAPADPAAPAPAAPAAPASS